MFPLLANYFLHEEPTGSFLIATTVAALMLAALGPTIAGATIQRQDNVLLLPVQMTTFAILGSNLITMGNETTIIDKITVLLYLAAAVMVISGLLHWLFSRPTCKSVKIAGN